MSQVVSATRERDDLRKPPADEQPARQVTASTCLCVLVPIVAVRAAVYAHGGVHLILDEWSLVFYGRGSFWGALSPEFMHSRPGAWLILTITYGFVGAHPAMLLVVISCATVALGLTIFVGCSKLVHSRLACATAVVWVLSASHNSLSVWAVTLPATISVILLIVGVVLLSQGR